MSAVESIKTALDIVAVIGGYVALSKSGRNLKALCPFHSERTASFYVFPDRQAWRCFGACATGGDVISFVMRREGLDFGETLRLLAPRAGVSLEERPERGEEEQKLGRLREALQAAALFYHDALLNSRQAEEARAYAERRGIDRETVQQFLLGYSPPARETLKSRLLAEGFSGPDLVDAGLLVEGENGSFDRFRGRLMFPIRDEKGSVVGFGARSLDGSNPKYLNSPQTALFDKSGTLYALDLARSAIRAAKEAVIVEGYMDALTAHQFGFHNVVAAMGTAVTERQMRSLSRLATTFVLALDADAAGQAATLRGLEVAPEGLAEEATAIPAWQGRVRRRQVGGRQQIYGLPAGMAVVVAKRRGEIKVARVPRGKDPDDLIRQDPEAWRELIANSISMMDFVFKSFEERFDLRSPAGKDQAVKEALPIIEVLPSPVEQGHYLQRLSSLVDVPVSTLRVQRPQRTARPASAVSAASGQDGAEPAEGQLEGRARVLEDYCLALLLQHELLRPQAGFLREDHFSLSENQEVFSAWQEGSAAMGEALDPLVRARVQELMAMPLPPGSERAMEEALAQCVYQLERRRLLDLKHQNRLRLMYDEEDPWVELQDQEIALNRQLHALMELKRQNANPVLSPEGTN